MVKEALPEQRRKEQNGQTAKNNLRVHGRIHSRL
jgi:hypothetical protein